MIKPKDKVVAEYRGYKVVVPSESVLGFVSSPVCWDENEKTIYCVGSFWRCLTERERKIILNHEIEERELFLQGMTVQEAHEEAMTERCKKVKRKIRKKYHFI